MFNLRQNRLFSARKHNPNPSFPVVQTISRHSGQSYLPSVDSAKKQEGNDSSLGFACHYS